MGSVIRGLRVMKHKRWSGVSLERSRSWMFPALVMLCHLSIRHPICGLRRSNSSWHSWTEMLTMMAASHPPNREQSRIGLVVYLAGMGKANSIRYTCPALGEHPHRNKHAPSDTHQHAH